MIQESTLAAPTYPVWQVDARGRTTEPSPWGRTRHLRCADISSQIRLLSHMSVAPCQSSSGQMLLERIYQRRETSYIILYDFKGSLLRRGEPTYRSHSQVLISMTRVFVRRHIEDVGSPLYR